jgi:Zn-dependent M16 (insulinase) family peptidase
MRQQYRNEVLDTTLSDFHSFGDVLKKASENGRVAVVGSAEAIKAASAEMGVEFKLTKLQ